jgi:hypothetical protein
MDGRMFFFFSSRLGCLGSILVSLALTAVLIAIFWL